MNKDLNKYEKWSYNQFSFHNKAGLGNRTEKTTTGSQKEEKKRELNPTEKRLKIRITGVKRAYYLRVSVN